jgi:ABC-type Co2+ transport system permease subunit
MQLPAPLLLLPLGLLPLPTAVVMTAMTTVTTTLAKKSIREARAKTKMKPMMRIKVNMMNILKTMKMRSRGR